MSGDYKRWKSGRTAHIHLPRLSKSEIVWVAAMVRAERVLGKDAVEEFLLHADAEQKTVDAETLHTLCDLYESDRKGPA